MDKNMMLVRIDEVFVKIKEILVNKSTDYAAGGDDFLANFRTCETIGVPTITGILIRTLDKIKRIQSFVTRGALAVKAESAEDAVLDIIGYAVIIYCVLHESDKTAPKSALTTDIAADLLRAYAIHLYLPDLGKNPTQYQINHRLVMAIDAVLRASVQHTDISIFNRQDDYWRLRQIRDTLNYRLNTAPATDYVFSVPTATGSLTYTTSNKAK